MFLFRIYNSTSTYGIDTNGLQELVDNISTTLDAILAVLIGLVGLAAIVVSILFLVKAGFTSEPEKRAKNLKAMAWLWGIVLGIGILWGLKAIIITVVQNSFTN